MTKRPIGTQINTDFTEGTEGVNLVQCIRTFDKALRSISLIKGTKYLVSMLLYWVDTSKVRVSGPKALTNKDIPSVVFHSSEFFRVTIRSS